MTKFKFSTKAQTLCDLFGHLNNASIPKSFYFSFEKWNLSQADVLSEISSKFEGAMVAIRSSCQNEDSKHQSNAGAFESILNVCPKDPIAEIKKVFDSYDTPLKEDEVLIQEMVENVALSGVAFSHDPNSGSPYRIINWTNSKDTTLITSGKEDGKTWIGAQSKKPESSHEIFQIAELIEELHDLYEHPIDIEFAISIEGSMKKVWLLQVRPLILKENCEDFNSQQKRLNTIYQKINSSMYESPFVIGKKTIYGVMPDWNPAEIIGVRPKPLSLSLYRELVTDAIWAYQRDNYGYRNLRSHPLMPHFFGLPYIDVRLSFNSFIPADLEEGLAGRLVDYYIDRLANEPELHDKIEFEIVLSCYTLDIQAKMNELKTAGFTESECSQIVNSLRKLTNKIIHPDQGLWKSDFKKIDILNARREELFSSKATTLDRIYWLLEDAKRYGTLPFAGLARAGFIAVQLLKSLSSVNILSRQDLDLFMSSVSTISKQISHDKTNLDKSTFLSRYGHLRPGTYDLESLRYDEAPELYFDWESQEQTITPHVQDFSLTLEQMKNISSLLKEHNLNHDVVQLFDFLKAGIELRELSKFHFTRNLSDILSLIGLYCSEIGIDKTSASFCDINVFKELYVSAAEPKDIIIESIRAGKARYEHTLRTILPPVITKPEDVFSFEWPNVTPNFVTQKSVTADVVSSSDRTKLAGKIVCIPSADPGYDWLFSYNISGLITAWGGVNSHMAIRAGELGLPAVIGAGERHYKNWSNAKKLFIDCAGNRVEVI